MQVVCDGLGIKRSHSVSLSALALIQRAGLLTRSQTQKRAKHRLVTSIKAVKEGGKLFGSTVHACMVSAILSFWLFVFACVICLLGATFIGAQ